MNRAPARRLFRDQILPPVAEVAERHGFRVDRGRTRFVRIDGQTIHEIDLGVDEAPRYAPGALLVLQPLVRVEHADLSPLLQRNGITKSGASISQPIAFGAKGAPAEWDVLDQTSAALVGKGLARVIALDVMPLLDDLREPEQLEAAYAARDPRISWHDQTVAAVIASYLRRGLLAKARDIADARFKGSTLDSLFPGVAALLRGDS